ncbi:DMT family transporter [Cohaesibacter celericrescens]|uniref:DMT family transporter n=1 Tax=Cohaesibacter celericrescens TaxID=2067669 RepID=UPI0035660FB3
MAWVYLVLAGILEIIWAYMLKQSDGFSRLVPSAITVVTMIGSFGLLSLSMRTLPLGTAYGIWTGIGAVGTFIVGILFLGELISPARIIAAILIVGGLLLMKFSSDFQM